MREQGKSPADGERQINLIFVLLFIGVVLILTIALIVILSEWVEVNLPPPATD